MKPEKTVSFYEFLRILSQCIVLYIFWETFWFFFFLIIYLSLGVTYSEISISRFSASSVCKLNNTAAISDVIRNSYQMPPPVCQSFPNYSILRTKYSNLSFRLSCPLETSWATFLFFFCLSILTITQLTQTVLILKCTQNWIEDKSQITKFY